jgi:hypothetical protein
LDVAKATSPNSILCDALPLNSVKMAYYYHDLSTFYYFDSVVSVDSLDVPWIPFDWIEEKAIATNS